MTVAFGGTFDPIHYGHLQAARTAAQRLGVPRVLMIPAKAPRLREPPHASASQRFEMLRIACESDPVLAPCDVDLLRQGAETRTIDTIEQLSGRAGSHVVWIAGNDAIRNIARWHRPSDLSKQASLVVLNRFVTDHSPTPEGFGETDDPHALLETPGLAYWPPDSMPAISSTAVREALRRRDFGELRVPREVIKYIDMNGLYRD